MINYKLHFIRHGMTQGNIEGKFVGRTDMPVCEEGFEKIAAIKDNLEYPRVEAVYCSPLLRCRQTAEFLYPDRMLTVVEDMQEMDFGEFEGKTIDELQADEDYLKWLEDARYNAPPGGESGEDFAFRLSLGLSKIFANMMQEQITEAAVVTHGGVIMTLLSAFGYPRAEMGHWMTENGRGYTILLTPQMRTRDNRFEVYDTVPSLLQEGDNRWDTGFYAADIDSDVE